MKTILVLFALVAIASCGVLQSEDTPQAINMKAFLDRIEKFKDIKDIRPTISNGTRATAGQFPYQVAVVLDFEGLGHFPCNGVLLRNRWVLTAAACFYIPGLTSPRIVLGSVDLAAGNEWLSGIIPESDIHIHPEFNVENLRNNIALIYVRNMPADITNNQNVGTVNLPNDADMAINVINREAIVSGYGLTDDFDVYDETTQVNITIGVLHFSTTTIVPNAQCQAASHLVFANNLCTHNPVAGSACIGDWGAPLTIQAAENRRILVGIAGIEPECLNGLPSIYESVLHHRQWIERTISGSEMIKINFLVVLAVFGAILKNLM